MYRRKIVSSILVLCSISMPFLVQASQFFKNCRPVPGSACGACEKTLSDRITSYLDEVTLKSNTIEGVIADLKEILADESVKLGASQLNWFVAPFSRSLIKPTPEFPKVILKSPNSEVWMAYGTDPQSEHFQSVELMRWIPEKAKFEFSIVERNSSTGNLTVDRSGARCIQCHTSRLRPIWDSYKAWPGIAPSRDDLLETDPRDPSRLEPMSEYYLSFLQKTKAALSREDRLSGLPSPFGSTEVLELKNGELAKNGYLRIPHFPATQYNYNFSKKTAKAAGPGHLAFDQLEALNLCAAADEIRQKSLSDQSLGKLSTISNWKSISAPNAAQACRQLGENAACESFLKNKVELKTHADQMNSEDRVQKQTAAFEALRNSGAKLSDEDILFWTKQIKRPLPEPLSVISDPGGVLPVGEADSTAIAAFQWVLQGTGIQLEEWSMSDAPVDGLERTRFSFSDQFNSILVHIPWKTFSVPSVDSVITDLKNPILNNQIGLSVVQIRDEQFSALGETGRALAHSILMPDKNNPLDNPIFALKVDGEKAAQLYESLKPQQTAHTETLQASSRTICSGATVCYVLLCQAPIEEFRSSHRLNQILQGITQIK